MSSSRFRISFCPQTRTRHYPSAMSRCANPRSPFSPLRDLHLRVMRMHPPLLRTLTVQLCKILPRRRPMPYNSAPASTTPRSRSRRTIVHSASSIVASTPKGLLHSSRHNSRNRASRHRVSLHAQTNPNTWVDFPIARIPDTVKSGPRTEPTPSRVSTIARKYIPGGSPVPAWNSWHIFPTKAQACTSPAACPALTEQIA